MWKFTYGWSSDYNEGVVEYDFNDTPSTRFFYMILPINTNYDSNNCSENS